MGLFYDISFEAGYSANATSHRVCEAHSSVTVGVKTNIFVHTVDTLGGYSNFFSFFISEFLTSLPLSLPSHDIRGSFHELGITYYLTLEPLIDNVINIHCLHTVTNEELIKPVE